MKNNKIEKQRERGVFSQRHELIEAIERKHEIPHKFAYLDTGANAWDAISKDGHYDLGKRELSTLKRFLDLASANLEKKPFNILHVGPGNGIEVPIIINTLGIQRIAHYALIDISRGLLKTTRSYGEKCFRNLEFLSFVCDVTKPDISKIIENLRRNGASRNIILLIANGAILSNSSVLTYIRKSMISEDRLFITLEVYSTNREKQIIEQYKLPCILELFAKSLALIGIYDPRPEQFEFLYNKKHSMIEVYFLVKKWLKLHPNADLNLEIQLPERIKVFSSFRPTPSKLRKFLINNGFRITNFHFFEKEQCCGCLCTV